MSQYLFDPPPVVAVPVRNRPERFPVRRIFCVGRNYEAHAKEMGAIPNRETPFWFTKTPSAYVASGTTIPYPPGTSNLHYEMELVAVIGKPGFHIPDADAPGHVYGYACGLDMTRRDLQLAAREQRHPWAFAKDFEQSAVLSEIVPASVCGHPAAGRIELAVNGTTRQSSDIAMLIHPVPALVAHLSRYYHLLPGDVIFTGTPEGVGPVVPGDRIEGAIAGVGNITLELGAAE